MFGASKPVVISDSRRRKGWRPPAWLLWWLAGVAIGAGGLWYVQENHLPPRLSAQASSELRSSFDAADAERKTLRWPPASNKRPSSPRRARWPTNCAPTWPR
jgi:hypothetical protein